MLNSVKRPYKTYILNLYKYMKKTSIKKLKNKKFKNLGKFKIYKKKKNKHTTLKKKQRVVCLFSKIKLSSNIYKNIRYLHFDIK